MTARSRRHLRTEGGFTLVELVVTVSILGIIVVPLTGVVLSYLRNTVDTEARLTESHDVQFAAAYWQRDVASIGVRSTTYDTASHSYPLEQSVDVSACPLPAGATARVTLAWSDHTTPATVKVTYATRPEGPVLELLRVRCGTADSTVKVADSLVAPPTVTCEQPGGGTSCTAGGAGVPAIVRLGLQVMDASGHDPAPYTATLTGARRQS